MDDILTTENAIRLIGLMVPEVEIECSENRMAIGIHKDLAWGYLSIRLIEGRWYGSSFGANPRYEGKVAERVARGIKNSLKVLNDHIVEFFHPDSDPERLRQFFAKRGITL